MKDKEIELKFIINEEQRQAIIKDLGAIAQKKGESHQIDTYYIPNFRDFEKDGRTIECVRIREDKKGAVLCYKHIHYEEQVYCDEYETKVESKDQMEKILFALGFSVQMVIDKKRESYKYKDFEFDFDSVKNLGELMEVELESEDASVEEIYEWVSKYGLSAKDVTYEGIQLLMKKANLKCN